LCRKNALDLSFVTPEKYAHFGASALIQPLSELIPADF
jgi:hypothetical protein